MCMYTQSYIYTHTTYHYQTSPEVPNCSHPYCAALRNFFPAAHCPHVLCCCPQQLSAVWYMVWTLDEGKEGRSKNGIGYGTEQRKFSHNSDHSHTQKSVNITCGLYVCIYFYVHIIIPLDSKSTCVRTVKGWPVELSERWTTSWTSPRAPRRCRPVRRRTEAAWNSRSSLCE